MTDLRNAVEDRPAQYNTNTYGTSEPSFGTRNASGYSSTPSAAPMPATDYYQSRWDQLKEQSWFPMAVVGGGLLVFALFIGYAYNQGASQSTGDGTAPVIAASEEPFKVAPTDAGGMVVPNQDTLVFDQIAKPADGATDATATENLIPPPEAPLVSAADAATTPATPAITGEVAAAPPAPQPAPATTVAAMTAGETPPTTAAAAAPTTTAVATPAPVATTATPATPPTTKAVETAPKAALVVKAEASKPAPAPKAVAPTPAPTPAPAPVVQAKPATLPPVATTQPAAPTAVATSSGTAKVQLGSFGSEAAAKAAWSTFQQKYGAQLGRVTPNFVRADLGAKGVFYRVQGVGLSAASAASICQAINAQQAGGCIVAK